MYQPVNERSDTYVVFKQGSAHPILRAFRWGNRRFDVTSVNLVHPEREGGTLFLCYSVSCGINSFRIRFNTTRCVWTLDAVEEA